MLQYIPIFRLKNIVGGKFCSLLQTSNGQISVPGFYVKFMQRHRAPLPLMVTIFADDHTQSTNSREDTDLQHHHNHVDSIATQQQSPQWGQRRGSEETFITKALSTIDEYTIKSKGKLSWSERRFFG
jgi:hypothetical protein